MQRGGVVEVAGQGVEDLARVQVEVEVDLLAVVEGGEGGGDATGEAGAGVDGFEEEGCRGWERVWVVAEGGGGVVGSCPLGVNGGGGAEEVAADVFGHGGECPVG